MINPPAGSKKERIDRTNFDSWLATASSCRNLVFQVLDLRSHDDQMAALVHASSMEDGCVYLGCELGPRLADAAARHHSLIFPDLPGRPFKPFRHELYTPEELFAGLDHEHPQSYYETPDWRSYLSYLEVDEEHKPLRPTRYVDVGPDEILARRLHDHFIEDALGTYLKDVKQSAKQHGVVAIMGGHDRPRSDAVYSEIAHLARKLSRDGYLVVSGGGPGLMEAANLGAYFAAWDDCTILDRAINRLKAADLYSDPHWLTLAWEVKADNPTPDPVASESLGIPTWFYGHEPPNVFSSRIAKYFENSLREEGLLAIATHGVIFAQGNAGTTQEIFQDACQNYYATYGFRSPMILFGADFWEQMPAPDGTYPNLAKPAWQLLRVLARQKGFEELITLTSDPDIVLKAIRSFRPPAEFSSSAETAASRPADH
ncbi:MAG: hypothetical protein R3F19_03880 [Verrucomicrobiales bacterium]